MASKKEVKPALPDKQYATLKVPTGTVKPAFSHKPYEKAKRNKKTVKKALPK